MASQFKSTLKQPNFQPKIFDISSDAEFAESALALFRHQAENNTVYRDFIQHLKVNPAEVNEITAIPFLPIEAFKYHEVMTGRFEPELVFTSSGTTGKNTSRHLLRDEQWYIKSFTHGFMQRYGAPQNYRILALLPGYLERDGSSLVYMVNHLIKMSQHLDSGFYLDNLSQLAQKLSQPDKTHKTLVIGVSFALLDLAEQFPQALQNTIIMETGGMKGRRREIIREELHRILYSAFGVDQIHSEYGMTELLSQAYSQGKGIFRCPPWMKALIRQHDDPLAFCTSQSGGLNIIDLANIHSCAFIATNDLGKDLGDDTFQVLGRFDYSDIRGCNLMVE